MTRNTAEALARATERTARSVAALGSAIHAAHVPNTPALARAVQAEQNLYDVIDREFGLLTSAEASARMGSRASALRNAATAARRDGELLALRRGRYLLFPGIQFDATGTRPVIAALIHSATSTVEPRPGWSSGSARQPPTWVGNGRWTCWAARACPDGCR